MGNSVRIQYTIREKRKQEKRKTKKEPFCKIYGSFLLLRMKKLDVSHSFGLCPSGKSATPPTSAS